MLKGLGGLGDMTKMMKAAQEMQTKMGEMQERLDTITVVGESVGLDIDPSIFDPNEKEVVEDLILAAIKDAQVKASERSSQEMQKITEELGLPAGMGNPFGGMGG